MVAQNFRSIVIRKSQSDPGPPATWRSLSRALLLAPAPAASPRIGSWFTQKQFSGAAARRTSACHMLDTCLHLLGEFDVKSVSARNLCQSRPRGLGETDWGKSEINQKKPFDLEDYSVASSG